MSQQLIDRSPDLKQLRDDGYDIEVRSNYLLVKAVPYVNPKREIKFGTLVSELTLAGSITAQPSSHVARFIGEHPCNADGSEIRQIKHGSGDEKLDQDLVVNHSFSAKPTTGNYKDYYEKVTHYVAVISSPAQLIKPGVTAQTYPVIKPAEGESVFNYLDTASSRAGINVVSRKLELGRIGIVGVGGTGSYVLDLVAKTLVKEIHLFDGDRFLTHNAFRSPGAPSVDELEVHPQKAIYFKDLYSRMHRNIIAHDYYINSSNVDQLQEMDFVFLCLDRGGNKRLIIEGLEGWGTPFIDVGMGVQLADESLGGILRITTSTVEKRDHVRDRIPFSDGDNNDYSTNIQIADLNALNAALAVVKWKKIFGFYRDFEKEYFSTYTIDGNTLINEDQL